MSPDYVLLGPLVVTGGQVDLDVHRAPTADDLQCLFGAGLTLVFAHPTAED